MLVHGIRVAGLRDAEGFVRTDLGARVELSGGPEGVAVADAFDLFAAGLVAGRIPTTLARLGISGEVEVLEEDGMPVQASWDDPWGARTLVAGDSARRITVWVEVIPDPPLFGQLREMAVREPRLVAGLSDSPRIAARVGWLFTKDWTAASIAVLEFKVGDMAFPASGPERPAWVPKVLRQLGARFLRWTPSAEQELAERLLAASLSPDAEVRDAYARAAGALADEPFELGALELARVGEQLWLCFGRDMRRARQFGPSAVEAAGLSVAAFLDAPDVLVIENPGTHQPDPGAVADWLEERTRGNDATLEQVILVNWNAS